MKFNRRLYPENWSDLALAVKQEAKWCCQKCGLKCIDPGEDTSKLTRSERMKRTLQTHHWDRNPSNNSVENLIALCSALCRIHVVEALM
jgi:Fe-S-cluster containining protein